MDITGGIRDGALDVDLPRFPPNVEYATLGQLLVGIRQVPYGFFALFSESNLGRLRLNCYEILNLANIF